MGDTMRKSFAAFAFAVAATLAQPASAITFSKLTTIYIGSGVRDSWTEGTMATAFLCTNVSGVTANIRVQVLFSSGNLANQVTFGVPHGQTRTVVTNQIATFINNHNLTTDNVAQGAVNIESTQSAVFCNALIMHRTNHAEGVPLRLVRINGHPGAEE
jgi:hypothetical protein